jgi:hypothetical protein
MRDFGGAFAAHRAGEVHRSQDLMPAARGVLGHGGTELVLALLNAGRIPYLGEPLSMRGTCASRPCVGPSAEPLRDPGRTPPPMPGRHWKVSAMRCWLCRVEAAGGHKASNGRVPRCSRATTRSRRSCNWSRSAG